MNQLTEDQLKEIADESEKLYPLTFNPSMNPDLSVANVIQAARQEAYTAAASKYILRIKDLEDGLRSLMENFTILTLKPNDFSCYTNAIQLLTNKTK